MTVSRAHFYLEMARELDLPLAIDPVRSSYLRQVVSRSERAFGNLVGENTIQKLTNKVTPDPETMLASFDVHIPAIPEYVLRTAQSKGISLCEATAEVRASRTATDFRRWCAEIVALAYEGTLSARSRYARAAEELMKACETWSRDALEGVEYVTRKLNLSDVPLLGKLLTATRMAEITVRDPVLVPDKKYRSFLFLNELLNPPRMTPNRCAIGREREP